MLAKEAMSQDAPSISPEATILEAASLLVNTRASALPVVDPNGTLLGILSEADVVAHVAGTADKTSAEGKPHRVSSIMTKDVIAVDENASLKSAIDLLMAKRLKIMPVCQGRTVIGTLGRAEVMRLITSTAALGEAPVNLQRDDGLRRRVLAAVKGHRWSLAQRFDVVVKDGAVHLWGVVPNEAVHASYCDAAENVPEAKSVVSHMHVMPQGVRMTGMV